MEERTPAAADRISRRGGAPVNSEALAYLGAESVPVATSLFGTIDEDMLAGVAHELRTPLQALGVASETLLEHGASLDKEECTRLIRAIRGDVVWLQGLLENALCSTNLQNGCLRLRRTWTNLADLAAEAVGLVEPILDRRGQQVELPTIYDQPLVWVDRQRLVQVIVNLLTNASKYSPPNASIEIQILPRFGWVQFGVLDSGPGLGGVDCDSLFAPRYRSPSARQSNVAGSGLGLAIVRALVEAHEGRVGAMDRVGGGACFWFDLPSWSVAEPDASAGSDMEV